jgi:sucrose-phosphate synthase
VSRENIAEKEHQFKFSRRISAERLSMQRAYRIITSTVQERQEQYAHPLYTGAVDASDDSRFSVIPPGVNTRVFHTGEGAPDRDVEAKLNGRLRNPDRPHLLVSSRIDEKKNILGSVAAYVSSPLLQAKAGLVICLRGIDDPFEEVDSLAEAEKAVLQPVLKMILEAGIRDKVDFLDIRSQAELAETYRYFARRRSLFVLTAFYEPFGLAPIEAAACGLACVATKNGGPSEIFADGSGVLVDPYDVDDIARGMIRALDAYDDLSKCAAERVRITYTWEQTAVRYLDVIKQGLTAASRVSEPVPGLDATARITAYLE